MRRLPVIEVPGGPRVRVARTWWSRARGLLGRGAPAGDEALWLYPCRSVHTAGMRYPIDLVWLDADDRVRRVDLAVPAWRVRGDRGAQSVLEVRVGRGEALAAAWPARDQARRSTTTVFQR